MITQLRATGTACGMSSPRATALLAPGRPGLDHTGLSAQVERCAGALRRARIERGDVVLVVMPNGPELACAILAAAAVGACAPLDPAHPEVELERLIGRLGPRALIVAGACGDGARRVARRLGVTIVEAGWSESNPAGALELYVDEAVGAPAPDAEPGPDDIALLLHTSGTTARPRIVPLTHRQLCDGALRVADALALTAEDRGINVMPLFHVHGLIAGVLAPLVSGGSVVCTPGPEPERFAGWCAETRPTWFTAVPTMHAAILAALRENAVAVPVPRFRFLRSASSALTPRLREEMETFYACPVVEAYGMTEAAHQIASQQLPPAASPAGAVGCATGVELRVVDAAGDVLPTGVEGEVVIRGEGVIRAYWNDTQADREAFAGGWLRTGDLGRIDEQGNVYLTGRRKEIINRGGESISPLAVEAVLLEHPQVQQAVAFGVPHATLGEDVAAAVVPADGAAPGEQVLRAFALSRLPASQVPARIVAVNALPTGPSGKLQRVLLADALAHVLEPERVAPAGSLQCVLAEIWAEVLGVQDIGAHDNFFGIGGDSLKAMRVTTRIVGIFDIDLAVTRVFANPTLTQLAEYIGSRIAPARLAQIEAALEGVAERSTPRVAAQ